MSHTVTNAKNGDEVDSDSASVTGEVGAVHDSPSDVNYLE
jgi:hypothetical protein